MAGGGLGPTGALPASARACDASWGLLCAVLVLVDHSGETDVVLQHDNDPPAQPSKQNSITLSCDPELCIS